VSTRLRQFVSVTLGSLLALVCASVLGSPAHAAGRVPYHDKYAAGTITLCDKNLQPITSGSVNDLPFVWRAVGSVAAPAPYNDGSGAAILYAFLPRKGVDPGQWDGELLTGSTIYHNPQHPMAQATPADWMLRYFSDDYIPKWNGYIELRLYYQHQGAQQSTAYAAADIQLTGQTWRLVRGGSDDCGVPSDAKSIEVSLPSYHQYVQRAARDYAQYFRHRNLPVPTNTATPGAPDPTQSSASSPTAPGPAPSADAGTQASDSASTAQTGINWWPLLAVAAVGVLVGAGVAWWRRPPRARP
jgi:hypothetical protein